MKRLFKKLANTNISTAYIFILLGISTLMMAGYFSYAWFTVQGVQKYSVVTGNLYGTVAIGTNSVTIAGQGVFNARLRCPFTLSGTGARPVPSVAAPRFDTRPGQ